METAEKVKRLVDMLSDSSWKTRSVAAYELARIGPAAECAVAALVVALTDHAVEVRVRAAIALGRIGPTAKSAVPNLIGACTINVSGEMREAIVDSLGLIGVASAVPWLMELFSPHGFRPFSCADSKIRCNAAVALGRIGPAAKKSIPELLNALGSSNPLRGAAASALVKIVPDAASGIYAIVTILDNP